MPNLVKFKVAKCDLKESRVDHTDSVKEKIFVMRGHRVMLDRDLAQLYGVTTKRLNQQFTRNRNRFPTDFAFRLTLEEAKQIAASRLQNATLKKGQNIKHPPHVFTEHGAIMLASVLNSRVAVQASVYVVRAFVQMRAALMEYAQLSRRIDALEEKYDGRFKAIFDAVRGLMMPATREPRQIGFVRANRRDPKEKKR
jgi:phage regulator Rha-like protein